MANTIQKSTAAQAARTNGNSAPTMQQYIKQMQKDYDATLLFGHDFDQIKEWSAKGWID